MVGKHIGKYQIVSELAHGRLGPIYRAQVPDQPQDAAREFILKTINLSLFTTSLQVQLKARFRREVYALRQLQHRNIVQVFELLSAGNDYFVVLENFPGATLRDLLMRQGVPNVVEAVSYGRQMLQALNYAHRADYLDESDFERTGIVHGDVRLSNLLLDQRGRIKLSDFSIIHKVIGGELRKLYPELIAYQSPEMQRGSAPDFRSDIFAAGAAFYEMLTGRLPSAALSNEDWRFTKLESVDTDAEALMNIRGDVPPALATAIARAVRRNPHDRFTTMGDFLRAVQAVESQLSGSDDTVRIKGNSALGNSGVGNSGMSANWPERPTNAPMLLPQNADSIRPALIVTRLGAVDNRKPQFAAGVTSTSLPGDTAFDVEPPTVRPKRDRWLFPALAASVLVGTLTGAYYFSSPRNNESLTSDVRSPVGAPAVEAAPNPAPSAVLFHPSPAASSDKNAELPRLPAVTVESPKLTLARTSELQERYSEALKAYEEYAAANPNTAAASNIPSRIAALRQFQTLINNAKDAYAASRFDEAHAQFNEALKLRPHSRMAQAGVKESGSRMAAPLTVPAISPPTEKGTNEESKETTTPPPSSNEGDAALTNDVPHAKPSAVAAPAQPSKRATGNANGLTRNVARGMKAAGGAPQAAPKSVTPKPATGAAKPAAKPPAKPANKPSTKIATALAGKP